MEALEEANGVGECAWQWMAYRMEDRRLVLTTSNTFPRKLFLIFHDPVHLRLQGWMEVRRFEVARAPVRGIEPELPETAQPPVLTVLLTGPEATFSIGCRDLSLYEWLGERRS
ncbi:MAG: hypothetical protein ACK47B_25585 [Armatimonadota bacterium]